MGSLHSFEHSALATLRARLGAAEEANEDLVAFARGHSGAVASIHRAVLAAIAAEDFEQLCDVVVRHWPIMLGIDVAALLISRGNLSIHAGRHGLAAIDPLIASRALAGLGKVVLREVDHGHPLFGDDCAAVRAEAMIRLDGPGGQSIGLLLLGQHRSPGIEGEQGFELLGFLGRSLATMMARCLDEPSH